ncbi:MAG: bifunctional nuclease family protein [Phycisphaeraceae bacterium]|nr:bifunctional nuclease family protein [Phycisphaeraceae bacterium]
MAVRVELSRILIHENSPRHVVELREADGERVLPIWIGLYEAAAIERRLMGQTPPRPQTHELLDSIIRQLGWRIDRIVITDFKVETPKSGTFYARLILSQGEKTMDIDSRPSDAIALGCAGNVPIFVEDRVFEQVERADASDMDNPSSEAEEGDAGGSE